MGMSPKMKQRIKLLKCKSLLLFGLSAKLSILLIRNRSREILFCFILFKGIEASAAPCATAQIIPDATLPNNSSVNQTNNITVINDGTRTGNNLFHSFERFDIPNNTEAFFNNSNTIENIFTRVTGNNFSKIDGIIAAAGTANLFFINPNGIVFGKDARLNIGGSFFASTASNIKFADGTLFSTEFNNTQNPPTTQLLTITAPIGLGFGNAPGSITVEGNGHDLTIARPVSTPLNRNDNNTGLQVKPGKTLALIGGNVNITGGILTAPGGKIELGSAGQQNNLDINSTTPELNLSYPQSSTSGNIQLSQQALVDVSGINVGSVLLYGRQVNITEGAVVLVQNQGTQNGGNIDIYAGDSLKLTGTTPNGRIGSSLVNETVASGTGGNINIKANALNIQDGASVAAKTFLSGGRGGNVDINASESIEVARYSPSDNARTSNITALSADNSDAGNITISTKLLSISTAGSVASFTQGSGKSGNIDIKAETIDVVGVAPGGDRSTIASSSLSSGNAGKVTINTGKLRVADGASVSSSGFSNSPAGSVTINALDSVEVTGRAVQTFSEIRSAIQIFASESVRRVLGLPDIPQGNAGDVTINTPDLRVSNEARVSAQNQGIGDGGTVKLNANLLNLDSKGTIIANTKSGVGGDIFIIARNIRLRNNSSIAATAQGNIGNGGNITIDTDTLTALENSDISANAEASFGGKVIVNARAIIGTEFRQNLTPRSDITATSTQGSFFNGVVDINSFNFDPSFGVVELPKAVSQTSDEITTGCLTAANGNRFIVTGRGGLPEDPTNTLRGTTIWSDLRPPKIEPRQQTQDIRQSLLDQPVAIVEATGWVKDKSGVINLVALRPNTTIPSWQQSSNCRN
jgi:filamentous hemagglutinin family protein